MDRRPDYGPPAGAAEFRALDALISFTYQFEAGGFRRWARNAGRGNARVARRGGEVVGGLFTYPMGQWFGGRVVPCLGVAGVGVAPERRAAGVGSAMMRSLVRECAARRVPLSSLYPATQPVYRQAGYGLAGHRFVFALPASSIDARERSPAVREARPRDRAAIRRLYREQCRAGAGLLERSPWLWRRVTAPHGTVARTYVVEGGDGPDGYVVVSPRKGESLHQDLSLLDVAFRTPAAGRRILAFLASQRSFVRTVRWNGGPQDALAALLGEQDALSVERHWRWMLRVCDVRGALEARGYPAGLSAEVHLDVEDDVVPGNAGRWTLRVAGGRGRAVRGGRGAVRCDVLTLASIYTGFASPDEAAVLGRVRGPAGDLAALGAAFAGPAPWIREMF